MPKLRRCLLSYCRAHCVTLTLLCAIYWYLISTINLHSRQTSNKQQFGYKKLRISLEHVKLKINESLKEIVAPLPFPTQYTNISAEKLDLPERFLIDISDRKQSDLMPLHDELTPVPDATTLNVTFLQLPPANVCTSDLKLIVTLKSAFNHTQQRNIIRRTWASLQFNDSSIQVVFLLGLPDNNTENVNVNITEESKTHQDIIQGTFVDVYTNLTVKSIMGLRWINTYCRNASLVLLGDDDIFLAIDKIVETYSYPAQPSKLLHCGDKMIQHARVTRKGRWATSFSKYNHSHYPPYCNGPCYLMSRDVALELYNTSLRTHTDVGVDDAMITGILRKKIDVELRKMPKGICQHLANSPDIETKLEKAWIENT